MKRIFIGVYLLLHIAASALFAQIAPPRAFREIFPGLSSAVLESAFSNDGYFKSYGRAAFSEIIGSSKSTIDSHIVNDVLNREPGILVESILVIPSETGKYSLLNVYNALGKTRGLKGRTYHSFTRKEDVPLFDDVTRIESQRRNVSVDDPPPALSVPSSEAVYMRLKDVNFGNSFYRGDMALEQRGLRYSLSNFRSITYMLVPVIKEEKFIAQLYFEPISEGILIYALAGADVSNFVSSRIDMASAIGKRLAVIIDWIVDGVTGGQ